MRSLYSWPTLPPNLEPPSARSLSLLFILQEWIASFQFLEKLKGIVEGGDASSLAKEIEKFPLENPLTEKGGPLDKLCFYSEILLQASKINDGSLLMVLEDMRHFLSQLRVKVLSAKKHLVPNCEFSFQALEFFQPLEQNLRAFFSSLVPFLQEARTDENVLIYLIEHKQTFNLYLGSHAIEKLLHRFFPSGQPHLRAVICEGFTRRGFSSFLAEKEPLIEELEWPQTPQSN